MSVEINWETLTGGPDGAALADTIRDFIHERFQQISLPKLVRSVQVHKFDFGTVSPQIVLKDICDPLPDFYDSQDEDEGGDHRAEDGPHRGAATAAALPTHPAQAVDRHARVLGHGRRPSEPDLLAQTASPAISRGPHLGGMSNLGYFHLPLAAGLSGTNTPLAAVAGARFHHNGVAPGIDSGDVGGAGSHQHHHSDSFGSITPPGTGTPSSRPTSREKPFAEQRHASALDGSGGQPPPDVSPEDMQVVFHVTYPGDVRLLMTAEVFLDFPMPSFVGIPLKLTITGVTFNGVGVLAYIKKRAHLCFLCPEDAEALVGGDGEGIPDSPDAERGPSSGNGSSGAAQQTSKVGGLLEEIKIESEMGEAGEGKQVLKNVGKIEKFILEQVQRIFEEEFVYPSFWTFLV